jgi:general secretion pathway protein I
MRERRARAQGFTLIEVMVAMAIMSLAVVTIIQLFGQGLRLLKAGGDHQRAALLADQKIRETTTLAEGIDEGEEDTFHWERRVTLEPEPEGTPEVKSGKPLRKYRVGVEVRWGTGKSVEVATLRTVREDTP